MSSEEKVRRADIFISYSHADEAWKNAIQKHLSVLQMQGGFSIWDDRQIQVGDDWLPAIEAAINQARVAILLVSADFLDSDFIARQEIPKFLERRKNEGLKVVPVVIRHCAWTRVRWLASLQGATLDNQPLAKYAIGSHDCDEALTRIVEKVDDLLQEVIKREQEISKVVATVQQPVAAPTVLEVAEIVVSKPKSSEQRLIDCWKRRANFDLPFEPVVFPYKHEPDWGEDKYGLWQALDVEWIRCVFRWIPAGTFMMGSPESELGRNDDEIQHQVTLTKGFWLGETTVTQALYQAVMGDNPSYFKGAQLPVEYVSWNDAQRFLVKLNQLVPHINARLPWEAEWEYACRAGTTTPFSFGDNITSEKVNYSWNSPYHKGKKEQYRNTTVAVKSLPASAWGLYEMHGNVWEWCQDWYGDYPAGAQVDPQGAIAGTERVLRGGSWNCLALFVLSARRFNGTPSYRSDRVGFRFALGQVS